jgi:heptosyltransferase-2/heptosyltransferase-3
MTRTPRQRLRLALLRAFARLARPSPPPSPRAARILVIRPDHLGDLLFVTPALRTLRQRYPDAHVTALVGPWGEAVLSNNPHVDETIALPFPGFTRQSKPSPWQPYSLLRHWARLLRGRYDLAFILRFDHWWGALLAYLAAVPQRVGYTIPEVAPFLTQSLPYIAGRHEVVQNLQLVNWELVDWVSQTTHQSTNLPITDLPITDLPTDHPIEFHVPEQAIAWARVQFQIEETIAIHPGAGAAVKLWGVERWAAVANALAAETGVQIVLTGSAAERSLCQQIAGQMNAPARVMAGETTLDQLAALFARCRLALGPDCGPLHLAVAVGTPTVHLYGPVDRVTFGPWGPPERHRALVSAWPCIPCNRLDYGADELALHPCVREIRVQEVLSAARQALSYYGP